MSPIPQSQASLTLDNNILSNSVGNPAMGASFGDLANNSGNATGLDTATIDGFANLVMNYTEYNAEEVLPSGDPSGLGLGVIGLTANPDLGPLKNNGGPTPTMALTSASPAFGAGSTDLVVARVSDGIFPLGSSGQPIDQQGDAADRSGPEPARSRCLRVPDGQPHTASHPNTSTAPNAGTASHTNPNTGPNPDTGSQPDSSAFTSAGTRPDANTGSRPDTRAQSTRCAARGHADSHRLSDHAPGDVPYPQSHHVPAVGARRGHDALAGRDAGGARDSVDPGPAPPGRCRPARLAPTTYIAEALTALMQPFRAARRRRYVFGLRAGDPQSARGDARPARARCGPGGDARQVRGDDSRRRQSRARPAPPVGPAAGLLGDGRR